MRQSWLVVGCLFVASCGERPASEQSSKQLLDVAEAPPVTFDLKENVVSVSQIDDLPQKTGASSPSLGTSPQIAYSYSYGYRLSTETISVVQQKHMAMCDALTAQRCRIVSMERASNDGEFSNAALTMQLQSNLARAFGVQLDKAAADAGGENSNRGIEAEDLSKQMSDTAAKIKAKQALADRLMLLLQNRSGKVGELVEAERAFADAQEELDAARSWMAEMQGRVSMSKIEISYNSTTPSGSGLWRPVRDSFASVGRELGGSIGALVTFVVITLPWLLLLSGIIWFIRRISWRIRMPWSRRKDVAE